MIIAPIVTSKEIALKVSFMAGKRYQAHPKFSILFIFCLARGYG